MKGPRAWSLASAVASALATSVYLIVITLEGNNSVWDVLPWAMLMVVGTAVSLSSALSSNASVPTLDALMPMGERLPVHSWSHALARSIQA